MFQDLIFYILDGIRLTDIKLGINKNWWKTKNILDTISPTEFILGTKNQGIYCIISFSGQRVDAYPEMVRKACLKKSSIAKTQETSKSSKIKSEESPNQKKSSKDDTKNEEIEVPLSGSLEYDISDELDEDATFIDFEQ